MKDRKNSKANLFGIMLIGSLISVATAGAQDAGRAIAVAGGDHYSVSNHAISAGWDVRDGHVTGLTVSDRLHTQTLHTAQPFSLLLKNGQIYAMNDLRVEGRPERTELSVNATASRAAEHVPGVEFTTHLVSADNVVNGTWSVILLDGSRYVRQVVTLTANAEDVSIRRVQLIDADLPGSRVVGTVMGSPLVWNNFFLGFEDPLSQSEVTGAHAVAYLDRKLPLKAGQAVTYSSVIGIARAGQMRRDFLAYIERERAHPYRTFLHYNSWYDLGRFNPYNEAGAEDRINAFGRELHQKRGVVLDSFLFDDGWDDHKTLWGFNSGFPQGFSNVRKDAEKYGTEPGVWMSPWGGYAGPKKERIAFGQQQGYEIASGGFALSGSKYYDRFREVCLEMIRKYGVNQFKFDGTGNADTVVKGSAFDSDFSAAIHLIRELRQEKPDIYINLTTGTYPSPFWLRYADSIWRGGEDDDVAGVGPYRERWITYRDADTYQHVVKAGPLYPLNSLMLHGIIFAERHKQLKEDPSHDFRNEVRSYFGTGTQLQEMYITPSLLSQENWDDLAEAAKWSRANASVLVDTHWVGGDPAWEEVYGWASWSPKKAILVLRNPSDKPQSIRLDPKSVFELPNGAAKMFSAKSPWKEDMSQRPISLQAGVIHTFQLAPFQVLTLELTPR
ncbi:enterotoxin [Granulicella sp. 5B5]|uniref:enterotoxin n=1 Tax=Granulicella sp. 5B5 TaxID=1617967 RepID=UPI0017791CAB|nr:enterotoxin [Granulicella sp. 5B5]QMV18398.1 enterotoxin [Granulicella sp. 5B5]